MKLALVFHLIKERDSYPSPLNYHNFPKSVCTSVNEGEIIFILVICHGIPDRYQLKDGDIVYFLFNTD